MILVAALVAPSILAACNFEPGVRDPWSARHAMEVEHDRHSSADVRTSSARADARSGRREAHGR
jgi:hypothetical protein